MTFIFHLNFIAKQNINHPYKTGDDSDRVNGESQGAKELPLKANEDELFRGGIEATLSNGREETISQEGDRNELVINISYIGALLKNKVNGLLKGRWAINKVYQAHAVKQLFETLCGRCPDEPSRSRRVLFQKFLSHRLLLLSKEAQINANSIEWVHMFADENPEYSADFETSYPEICEMARNGINQIRNMSPLVLIFDKLSYDYGEKSAISKIIDMDEIALTCDQLGLNRDDFYKIAFFAIEKERAQVIDV